MFKKKRDLLQKSRTTKDTLVIVGNGFDIWQGLHTSYSEFQTYYLAHRDEILRKLRIKKKTVHDEDGQIIHVSDVELIYGDPFHPQELDKEFWHTFKASLDKLDAERINLFFGKERSGLRKMEKSICNAHKILREAFCDWIATITIDGKDAGYRFGDNFLFINFNYTDTLIKRFEVKKKDEHHIHGEASDKESIIVGHSNHPQLPEEMLYRLGGRFRGLYFVEKILYETDKHVRDNIDILCMFLALSGARVEEIKNIYVVGHSMAPPDLEYFHFLFQATRMHNPEETGAGDLEESGDREPLEELHLRMQYAIQHGGYGYENNSIDLEQIEAVDRRFELEQRERSQAAEKEFFKIFKRRRKNVDKNEETSEIEPRTEDAMWHISYYNDKDKLWVEKVMENFACKKFKLYPTIDECLETFKSSQ